MRITGGKARGIQLDVPHHVDYLRPATDYLRESVFSSLGRLTDKAMVLDLFAGVGGYGLEALSRGAIGCLFVEKARIAAEAIQNNIQKAQKSAKSHWHTKVFCQDVFDFVHVLQQTPEPSSFDIIFLDPPYNMIESKGTELLQSYLPFLKQHSDARILFEMPSAIHLNCPSGLTELRRLGRVGNARQPNMVIYGRS